MNGTTNKILKSTCLIAFTLLTAICCQPSEAKTYKMIAESLTEISAKETPKYITVQLPAQKITGSDFYTEKDVMLRAKVTRVEYAKRGKRDGYIEAKLLAYALPSENNRTVDISEKNFIVKVKRYTPTDFKGIAQSAATSVAGQVLSIPFFTQGVAAVKGAVKPIDGQSRLKSAGISAYESSPLTYLNKGKDLNVSLGDKLTIILKIDTPDETAEPQDPQMPQASNLSN